MKPMFKIVVATVLSGLAALMADSMSPAATPVSGATEPQYAYTNRLIHEKSPYLLQHAHNPVDWYPWGAEAFVQARKEIKPIFLSVDYSTCHWCHVMERESFENPAIARILNDNFVCIKVDREERPDVNGVYMTFVQATAGGGWPLTVWVFIEDWAKLQVYRHLDLKAKLHFKFLDRVHEPLHAHKL